MGQRQDVSHQAVNPAHKIGLFVKVVVLANSLTLFAEAVIVTASEMPLEILNPGPSAPKNQEREYARHFNKGGISFVRISDILAK